MVIKNQDAFAVHSKEAVSGSFTIAAKNAGKEDIMQNVYEKLISCYESIQEKIPFTPRVALVLGSGLGDYAEKIRVEAELDYHEIDGFHLNCARTCRKIYFWMDRISSGGVHEWKSSFL